MTYGDAAQSSYPDSGTARAFWQRAIRRWRIDLRGHSVACAEARTVLIMCAGLLSLIGLPPASRLLAAEPVAVRYQGGSIHGFLVLRNLDGKVLAAGDQTRTVHGARVMSRLIFRFKDGSIDDETVVYSQRDHFRLISDHHIQRGPTFPKPMDILINASTGDVTVRYEDKAKEKTETDHLDLPPDLANGILPDLLENLPPETQETNLSYVAATPKPRLVKLSIMRQGQDTYSVAGTLHEAVRFTVKVELGGITGVVAPMVGKQPADAHVWISAGSVPAFLKLEGQSYEGGPIWRTEMTSAVWRGAP